MASKARLVTDGVLGVLGATLTVLLLIASERVFAMKASDSDVVGGLLLLAAAGQAAPTLGLMLMVHRLLLRTTKTSGPKADKVRSPYDPPPTSQNLFLVALVAFAVAFMGVFALFYSTIFVPVVALAIVGWHLYVPLARDVPRTRAVWRVLSASAVTFGLIALGLVRLAHL
ncbi:MAG: hypothetical protein ACAI38_11820 [Myxococcota bacterium]|nr:hypothetical protein [Myxococcota bacterium]